MKLDLKNNKHKNLMYLQLLYRSIQTPFNTVYLIERKSYAIFQFHIRQHFLMRHLMEKWNEIHEKNIPQIQRDWTKLTMVTRARLGTCTGTITQPI